MTSVPGNTQIGKRWVSPSRCLLAFPPVPPVVPVGFCHPLPSTLHVETYYVSHLHHSVSISPLLGEHRQSPQNESQSQTDMALQGTLLGACGQKQQVPGPVFFCSSQNISAPIAGPALLPPCSTVQACSGAGLMALLLHYPNRTESSCHDTSWALGPLGCDAHSFRQKLPTNTE